MAGAIKPTASRTSARGDFVAATESLLRRRGYAASGLKDIVAASGAPKGSLYFHFPGGKEQLAVTAMRSAGANLRGAIRAVLAAHDRPADGVSALVDAMAAGLRGSEYRDGCPIATVALEAASESQAIRAAAAEAFSAWTDEIERALARAGMPEQAARRRAMFVLAAVEGALILARAAHDPEPLVQVREELAELLGH